MSVLFAVAAVAQIPYVTPLRITAFSRGTATLEWTNDVAAYIPVYQMLKASSPTGLWQHFFFVTNRQTTTLTNSLAGDGGAFHKLAWFADVPMLFDYAFDEGYGFTAVTGRLTISFLNPALSGWVFGDTGFSIDGYHPLGSTNRFGVFFLQPFTNHFLHANLTPVVGDHGSFLEGTLQRAFTNGSCVYTGMAGTVYGNTIAGPQQWGTFKARRVQ